MKPLSLLSTLAIASMLAACADSAVKPAASSAANIESCKFPGTPDVAPGWVCDEPVPGWDVTAPGYAEKTAAGLEFQKQMAMTSARVLLAQQFKVHVSNMVKKFAETTGTAGSETVDQVNTLVTKQITDQTLVGSKVIKSTVAPDGKLWVLMGIDAKGVEALTKAAVKDSFNDDHALWQKFQGNKTQDELATAIASEKVADAPSPSAATAAKQAN